MPRRFIEAVLWVDRLATPSSRVWELEQRYKIPLGRPGYLGPHQHLSTTRIWNTSSSTARWSGPTPALRERPAGGQAAQALGRSRGGFSTKVHGAWIVWAIPCASS